jgi:hypothetical protein
MIASRSLKLIGCESAKSGHVATRPALLGPVSSAGVRNAGGGEYAAEVPSSAAAGGPLACSRDGCFVSTPPVRLDGRRTHQPPAINPITTTVPRMATPKMRTMDTSVCSRVTVNVELGGCGWAASGGAGAMSRGDGEGGCGNGGCSGVGGGGDGAISSSREVNGRLSCSMGTPKAAVAAVVSTARVATCLLAESACTSDVKLTVALMRTLPGERAREMCDG